LFTDVRLEADLIVLDQGYAILATPCRRLEIADALLDKAYAALEKTVSIMELENTSL
jgi:hypothetical protein